MQESPNMKRSKQQRSSKANRGSPSSLLSSSKVKEIFMDSAKKSYISKMAGKRSSKSTQQHISQQQAMAVQQSSIAPSKKHIHFSSFRGVANEQNEESTFSDEKMKCLYIVSFTDDTGKRVEQQSGFVSCCESFERRMFLCETPSATMLQFYKLDYKGNPKGLFFSLNFDTVNVYVTYDDIPQNTQLSLCAGPYKLVLEHDSWQVMREWFRKLMRMRGNSKSCDITLNLLENTEQFYKTRYQTEEFFVNNCQTGDIILFEDSHFFAKVQRFITSSDFDHVGLVVRDPTYGILIFEATSGSGVCLTPWTYMITYSWYKSIPRIVWRRLTDVDRDPNFILTIEKFILENLSKSYNISFAKITSAVSYVVPPKKNGEDGDIKREEDESGFFCSQLVATVYKQLGLISRDRTKKNYLPACKFYPGDFAVKSGRQLDCGKLSPQYQIYFDPQLLRLNYDFDFDTK